MDWASCYSRDAEAGVLLRTDRAVAHAYSDGAAVEEYILESIRDARDFTSGSDELVRRIRDWPSEYHFSASRASLLAPFDLRGLHVLEVGSGCGALTRALGEGGAHVVALEGSLERARITASRCRDLDDVVVVCDDFRDFLPPAAFDVVLFVGVLEYAPCYFAGRDPVGAALDLARGCLADDGAVIVAIENQFGLKYFAGASEDHHGRAFFGIEDRYAESSGPETFGHGELRRRLVAAGFAAQAWYYTFPDYKLPRLILSEQGLADPRLPASQLVASLDSRDYVWPHPQTFAQDAAWEVAGRNGLIADLANSFLVAASASKESAVLKPPGWLAELRTTNRVRPYRTITRFVPAEDELMVVKTRAAEGLAEPAGSPVRLVLPEASALLHGVPMETRVRRLLRAPDIDPAALAAVLFPWVDLLRSASTGPRSLLPGYLLDLLPRNLMEPPGRPLRAGDAASLTPFDLEWDYVPELEIEHVIFRGLVPLLLEARGGVRVDVELTTADVIHDVSTRLGPAIAPELIAALIEREAAIQSAVFGMDEQDTCRRIASQLGEPLDQNQPLDAALGLRDARIHDLMLIVAERDARVAEQGDRIAGLERLITDLEHTKGDLERMKADLEHQTADQEASLKLQAAMIESLAAQIKAVEASASWKVTGPLRRLRRRPGAGDPS